MAKDPIERLNDPINLIYADLISAESYDEIAETLFEDISDQVTLLVMVIGNIVKLGLNPEIISKYQSILIQEANSIKDFLMEQKFNYIELYDEIHNLNDHIKNSLIPEGNSAELDQKTAELKELIGKMHNLILVAKSEILKRLDGIKKIVGSLAKELNQGTCPGCNNTIQGS